MITASGNSAYALFSIDEYIKKVNDNGGTVVTEKMSIPGVGSFVYCKDVEGTMFGILQQESKPK